MTVEEFGASSGGVPLSNPSAQQVLQKPNKYEPYLPYRDKLQKVRQTFLAQLKSKLPEAILIQGEPLLKWIEAINVYLDVYGYAFTKEEHVAFLHLGLQALLGSEENCDFVLMKKIISIMRRLLAKPHLLTRKDLVLEWRSFWQIFQNNFITSKLDLINVTFSLIEDLFSLVQDANVYFPKEATGEMLAECRQYLCVYGASYWIDRFLNHFLPTSMPPELHSQYGFGLWLEDLMREWMQFPNNTKTQALVDLFGNLARDANGFVDWSPYIAIIFERCVADCSKSETNRSLLSYYIYWVVHMISPSAPTVFEHLARFFQQRSSLRLVSGLAGPTDRLFRAVLSNCLRYFLVRLHRERRPVKKWFHYTPETHLLTDELVKQFATIMMDSYDKVPPDEFDFDNLNRLALICTENVDQRLLPRLELAWERLSEPARLNYVLELFSISLYQLAINPVLGQKYRNKALSIMSRLVNSLNSNEESLCFMQIYAINSILILDPPLNTQLPPQSDIGGQFLEAIFRMIESENEELFKMYKCNFRLDELIQQSLHHILARSPHQTILINQLHSYVTNRLFEDRHCCIVLASMIEACLVANPSYTLGKFYPTLSRKLRAIIGNESKISQICKSEYSYTLRMLSACFEHKDARHLLPYQSDIISLLKAIFTLDYKTNSVELKRAKALLHDLLYYLTNMSLVYKPVKNKNDWPLQIELKELEPLNWFIPSKAELSIAQTLSETFIKPQIALLTKWTNGQIELSEAQLEKSIHIIGTTEAFKQSMCGLKSNVGTTYLEEDIFVETRVFDQSSREEFIRLILQTIDRLRVAFPDNNELFIETISILRYLLLPIDWSDKKVLEGKEDTTFKRIYKPLVNRGKLIPMAHSVRLEHNHLQILHTIKMYHNKGSSSSAVLATDQLLCLSTCGSSSVRSTAQSLLLDLYAEYPHLVDRVLPQLVSHFDPCNPHDALKGSLYILLGYNNQSLLLTTEWHQLLQLWPALARLNFAEKPQIAKLFDKDIVELLTKKFTTFSLRRRTNSAQLDKLLKQGISIPPNIEHINDMIEASNQTNLSLYTQLVLKLVAIVGSNQMHWRFHSLALQMLLLLIRHDCPPPEELVEITLDNFVHDRVDIRQIAAKCLKGLLLLARPCKETVRIDSSTIPQFDSIEKLDCTVDEQTYCETIFYDKPHIGYYGNVQIAYYHTTTRSANQSESNKYANHRQIIRKRFSENSFLEKIFTLYSVETDADKIDVTCSKIWKCLFQTFQLFNWELIFPKIDKLLEQNKKSSDKFAIEILYAMCQASSWFDYDNFCRMKSFLLQSIIRKKSINFDSESLGLWQQFFSVFANRDLRRYMWAFDGLLENTFSPAISAYYQKSNLAFIWYFVWKNWRFQLQIDSKLLPLLEQNLSHDYQNVRIEIGSTLTRMFHCRMDQPGRPSLSRRDFIRRLELRLREHMTPLFASINEDNAHLSAVKSTIFDSDSVQGKQLTHLIYTVGEWTDFSHQARQAANFNDFLSLLPYFCLVQSNDSSLQSSVMCAIKKIANHIYESKDFDSLLSSLTKLSTNWNWQTRKTVLTFLQHFSYRNAFMLAQHSHWLDAVLQLTVRLLHDPMIEVRQLACYTLGSLIALNLFDATKRGQLIEQFKRDSFVTGHGHGAILGLCAFVYAYPDDVPDFLPDILVFLARRMSDPQPIPKSIKEALGVFKQLHIENWIEYESKFTSEQLLELADVIISPSCYI